MKLSDYPKGKFIKCVLAGQPARGKTTAGLSFPTPMLIFDFDGKLTGPIYYATKFGIDLSQIEVESPADWGRDWERLAMKLVRFRSNPDKFKTFGLDSLTSLADFLLSLTGENKLKDSKQVKKIGGIQVPAIDEYNAESAGIMDLLIFMKEVQAHFWLTAHVIETRTASIENQRPIISRTLLTGGKKVAAKIPAYFPENYAFNIEMPVNTQDLVRYICYTKPNEDDYARTELPLPPKFDFTEKLFFNELMRLLGGASS